MGKRRKTETRVTFKIPRPYTFKDDIICSKCREDFLESRIIGLTSYPISLLLQCPACETEFYYLWDGVVCTQDDYEKRVKEHYFDKSGAAQEFVP